MKLLFFKLLFVPFAAYFAMMLTVAVMGSIIGINGIKELFPDSNAMPIWLGWIVIIIPIVVTYHFKKSVANE